MYYHALLSYDYENKKTICYSNYSKEEILKDAIIPFVNGQVVPINSGNRKTIYNLKSAFKITIYKTSKKVVKKDGLTEHKIIKSNEFQENNCTEEVIQEYQSHLVGDVKSDLQRKYADSKNHIFVIMKFGDKALDSAYEGVIEPIIREFNFEPVRVDKVQNSGKINDQIIDYISTSKYVIADLTGERPNTYYEAGFAHALGKETILTIRSGEKIHFDLSNHRFIQWDTEADLRKQLKERFVSLTKSVD